MRVVFCCVRDLPLCIWLFCRYEGCAADVGLFGSSPLEIDEVASALEVGILQVLPIGTFLLQQNKPLAINRS